MITAMSKKSNQLDKDSLYKLLTVGNLNNRHGENLATSPTSAENQTQRLKEDRGRLPLPAIEGVEDSSPTQHQKPELASVAIFVVSGPQQGERFTVTLPCTIGRKECDLTLKDRLISRRHAELKLIDNQLVIEDLASKNGTRVNGKIVTNHKVTPNDLVSIGPTNLRIHPA
jgi:pSer/pThr/pTyr-binding forkhead associated (FHA) protein